VELFHNLGYVELLRGMECPSDVIKLCWTLHSVMSQLDIPLLFLGHALETATFTLNRVSSKSVVKTSYEMCTGKCPRLSFLKIWDCEVYVE